MRILRLLLLVGLLSGWPLLSALAAPVAVEAIDAKERCAVCGMFVAKYPNWVTQTHYASGKVRFFDGMKDMLAFNFNPEKFGGCGQDLLVNEIWARDYYTLEWIDARKAYFVLGSAVSGPMGHEFIPFASAAAAENFRKDHQGKEVLTFEAITAERVEMMRAGHKMGHGH